MSEGRCWKFGFVFWSRERASLWLWWSCSCKSTCICVWSVFIAETDHDSNTDEATLVLAEFVFHVFNLFSCRVFWSMPVSWTQIQVFYNRYRLPILICCLHLFVDSWCYIVCHVLKLSSCLCFKSGCGNMFTESDSSNMRALSSMWVF